MRSMSEGGVWRITTASPTGTISAPPIPCTMRASTKGASPCASPQPTDAVVNNSTAPTSTVREPKRRDNQCANGDTAAAASM